MGHIYLIRHGQASFGADDYDKLSPLGHQQSERLGQYLAQRSQRMGLTWDAVLTGSLRRHAETWAGVAKGGNFTVNQAGEALTQAGPIDAHVLGDAGSQVVDQNVSTVDQALKGIQTIFAFEVQRQRLFATVEQMKVQRIAAAKHRAHATPIVAAINALYFQHLSTEVGKNGPGKRAGQDLAQFDHAQATQRAVLGRGQRFWVHAASLWIFNDRPR